MSASRTPRDKRPASRGGLPPDDDLSVFAAAANTAFGSSSTTRPPLSAVPDSTAPAPADPAPAPAGRPADPAPEPGPPAPESQAAARAAQPASPAPLADEPDDDDVPAVAHGDLIRQATIQVAANVAERFRLYQRREARKGPAPSNTLVVYRALNACDGRYQEVVASRLPKPAPGRFGAPVPGQRLTSEARLTSQINFRPTYRDVADFRSLKKATGARSVSAFLDAVLDEFLPPLKRGAARSTQP